jgi:hypothetical protein
MHAQPASTSTIRMVSGVWKECLTFSETDGGAARPYEARVNLGASSWVSKNPNGAPSHGSATREFHKTRRTGATVASFRKSPGPYLPRWVRFVPAASAGVAVPRPANPPCWVRFVPAADPLRRGRPPFWQSWVRFAHSMPAPSRHICHSGRIGFVSRNCESVSQAHGGATGPGSLTHRRVAASMPIEFEKDSNRNTSTHHGSHQHARSHPPIELSPLTGASIHEMPSRARSAPLSVR